MMTTGKNTVTDLAIFGGRPAFSDKLHVGKPNIGDRKRFLDRVNAILDSRWLTNNGASVQEFEREIEKQVGVRHCIATCNGTLGMQAVIRVLELHGEVLVPSFTFIATAHSLSLEGVTPVFCDIEPETCCIDPIKAEKKITPRTSGIIGVDLWGNVCNVDSLSEIARSHKLKLVFDAAHSFGSSCNGNMVGTFGDATVFSFHATKFVNAFEGGAVVTNNDAIAAKLRRIINFGFTGIDQVTGVGMNAKMSEVSAAMGLTSLESMQEFISINRRNYNRYRSNLDGVPGFSLVQYNEKDARNYQYVPVRFNSEKSKISRDDLIKILWKENVLVRRYFYPGCHRMEPYRTIQPQASKDLAETEQLSREIICFPTGQSVSINDIDRMTEIVRLAVENAGEITKRLSQEQVDRAV
jgi:dTDP-4-amino-4,6-dideoxygalactose transaminase